MTARTARTAPTVRYQTALLLRSQRWLPPFLLYAAFLGIGVQGGQPLLDSLGYSAAALLPVAAWLVRICVGNEPPAARTVVAAAVGPARAHLACVLVALGTATVFGTAATALVGFISDPVGADHQRRVPVLAATAAGLLAALTCALLGTAVGVLTSRLVLRTTG
ncbi:ABC transporter, partial [Streptomyces sp. NPDC002920]